MTLLPTGSRAPNRFGGSFHADGGSGAIEVVVSQRDATAQWVISPPFTLDSRAVQLRFSIYLNTPRTVYADDLWVTRTGP